MCPQRRAALPRKVWGVWGAVAQQSGVTGRLWPGCSVCARRAETAVRFPVSGTGLTGVRCCALPPPFRSSGNMGEAPLPGGEATQMSESAMADRLPVHVQFQLGSDALRGDPAASVVSCLPRFGVNNPRTVCPRALRGDGPTSSPGSVVAALGAVRCTHRQWEQLGRHHGLHRARRPPPARAALPQTRGCGGLECSRKTREQSQGRGTRL